MMSGAMARGLLAAIACIGVTAVVLRILGLGRAEALYLACLSFALIAYLLSRRGLRRRSHD